MRGVLLDIAGVLTAGSEVLPGAIDAVARLSRVGVPFRYLTNTTSKPKRQVLKTLADAGLPADETLLFTPAAAARAWLAAHGHAAHLLTVPALAEDFAGLDLNAPPAVVVGDAGEHFTYDRLNRALRLLLDGAPLLALAMNRRFTDADGRPTLDAGAFVSALAYGSGTDPIVFGKPAAEFFATACADLDCAPGDVTMIGDDAEADVAGALAAGLGQGILVRTGKYRPGDETAFEPHPSAVVADIGAAADMVLAAR